jgi:hypothetical protein
MMTADIADTASETALGSYLGQLRQVSDGAFHEGEHAA